MSTLTKALSREVQKLKLCMLHVVRAYDLTTLMRRIVLGGADLETFDVPSNALGPYIKLLIPPQGVVPEWPTLSPDGRLLWPPVETRPVMRTYSVRKFDKEAGEMHVDFVLHGDRGIASGWAMRAQPGDPVGVWGPGCVTTQNIDWYLLAGDHTALPAIAFILENLPETAKGRRSSRFRMNPRFRSSTSRRAWMCNGSAVSREPRRCRMLSKRFPGRPTAAY